MNYIIYKTTNLINDKIYVGFHKCQDLCDGYLGSGKYLKRSIKKYGVENFKREVLHNFDNEKDMKEKEKEIVNEQFLKRTDVYNLILGGQGGSMCGFVSIPGKRITKKEFDKSDYHGVSKGRIANFNSEGYILYVNRKDKKLKTGEYIPCFNINGNIGVIDITTNIKKRVTKKEFYSNSNLISIYKNMILVKDEHNNKFSVHKSDNRYINGELVGITKGENNQKTEYKIYDNNGNLKFHIINENFISFCKKNKLPYGALIKSYQKKETIYQKIGSNLSRLQKTDMLQYIGWYAEKCV
jgi:hypothetical protein